MTSIGGKIGSQDLTIIINNLLEEVKTQEAITKDVEVRVERARRNIQVIAPTIEKWFAKSKLIKEEAEAILKEILDADSGCLNVLAHFSLSKRAKKITNRIKKFRADSKFNEFDISMVAPPASTKPIPLGTTYAFESRKQIEDDIVATLVAGDVNTMGICGMGGLGKTITAKRIMNKSLEMKVFDEIAIVVVGQIVDKWRVHLEIGGSLDLKLDGVSWPARVQNLRRRLSGTERILVVLDDVWEILKLEDLGIPCNHKGCTIIIISQNIDVVKAMGVEKIFEMEVLSNEDAWLLFRNVVGKCVDDNTELNSIAKEVMNECKGLPIALITVGATLKDVTRMPIWIDRLRQLRSYDPSIPIFLNEVSNFPFLPSNDQACSTTI